MAKKILIVDDSESIRLVVCTSLRAEGYEVIVGNDGQHALDLLLESGAVSYTHLTLPTKA